MTTIADFAAARRMTEAEYCSHRESIRATYGDSATERHGLFDQELARLFYQSGWTQEQLAATEQKSHQWVSRRLLFGRFLMFAPTGANPKNLTERRFREYWNSADKNETNERIRFRQVEQLMKDELALSKDHAPKKLVAEAILATSADGEWHRFATIVERAGASEDDVRAVLTLMEKTGTYHTFCEKRKGGTSYSYRIVRGHGRKVDVDVLFQQVQPIVRALEAEGRKHAAQSSPGTIAKLAHTLKTVLEQLAHESLRPTKPGGPVKGDDHVFSTTEVGSSTSDTGDRSRVP